MTAAIIQAAHRFRPSLAVTPHGRKFTIISYGPRRVILSPAALEELADNIRQALAQVGEFTCHRSDVRVLSLLPDEFCLEFPGWDKWMRRDEVEGLGVELARRVGVVRGRVVG